MAPLGPVRTLHWVARVANRTETVDLLHNALGMHALRHEEFSQGCAAACNGPYDGRWSKTMMGGWELEWGQGLGATRRGQAGLARRPWVA